MVKPGKDVLKKKSINLLTVGISGYLRTSFEAKNDVLEAVNIVLTLNQPNLGPSPRQFTLDTELV